MTILDPADADSSDPRQKRPDPVSAHPLDAVTWSSLTGPHAHFAQGTGPARCYPPDVSPFAALDPILDDGIDRVPSARREQDDQRWPALSALVGPGGSAALSGTPSLIARMPGDWKIGFRLTGVQMISTEALISAPDAEAVLLGPEDVGDMLDLVRRTEPGPFGPRTHEMGRYLGIRCGGALIAMAGERLHPPGFTEISAVCTDPAFRGQGLAGRLIRAVAHGIRERGETPFLHAAASNVGAIGLYEALGFAVRLRPEFFFLHAPESRSSATSTSPNRPD